LYTISELAQHLLTRQARTRSWIISNYPAKVELPGDIFVRFRESTKAGNVQRKVYLTDEVLAQLQSDAPRKAKTVPMKRKQLGVEEKSVVAGRSTARPRKRQKKTRPAAADESSDSTALSEVDTDADDKEAGSSPKATDEEEESDLTSLGEDEPEQLGRGARSKARAAEKARQRKVGKRSK